MEKKKSIQWKSICSYLIKVLAFLCIAFVAFEVYINGAGGQVNKLWVIAVMAAVLFCLVQTKQLARKHLTVLEKYFPVIAGGYLVVLFLVQLGLGNLLRFTPAWDLNSVYSGAISWVEQGNIASQQEYFYYFPNNIGLLAVFRVIFGAAHALFGNSTDYFMAGVIAASISLTVLRFSVIWICKKKMGVTYAIVAMVLMLFCLPLYFGGAVFYTDIMSMSAPALFYLLYLYSKDAVSWKGRIGWYVAMALVAAVGMEIKFTVAILVIAVLVEMLLKDDWRHFLVMAGVQILVIAGVFAAVNHMVYPSLLDRQQAEKQNTPYLHWVMMGAKGEGYYNPEDYEFTRSFDDPDARDQAIMEEVKKRYCELGVQGVMNLWKAKTTKDFGDGTYALSDFLDDSPVNETGLHKWILYDGENYQSYQTICMGVHVLIFLLMLAGIVESLCRRGTVAGEHLAIWLAFFGLWLFLMFWETSGRYFSNYLPVMLIGAVMGLEHALQWVTEAWNWLKISWENENL